MKYKKSAQSCRKRTYQYIDTHNASTNVNSQYIPYSWWTKSAMQCQIWHRSLFQLLSVPHRVVSWTFKVPQQFSSSFPIQGLKTLHKNPNTLKDFKEGMETLPQHSRAPYRVANCDPKRCQTCPTMDRILPYFWFSLEWVSTHIDNSPHLGRHGLRLQHPIPVETLQFILA